MTVPYMVNDRKAGNEMKGHFSVSDLTMMTPSKSSRPFSCWDTQITKTPKTPPNGKGLTVFALN